MERDAVTRRLEPFHLRLLRRAQRGVAARRALGPLGGRHRLAATDGVEQGFAQPFTHPRRDAGNRGEFGGGGRLAHGQLEQRFIDQHFERGAVAGSGDLFPHLEQRLQHGPLRRLEASRALDGKAGGGLARRGPLHHQPLTFLPMPRLP